MLVTTRRWQYRRLAWQCLSHELYAVRLAALSLLSDDIAAIKQFINHVDMSLPVGAYWRAVSAFQKSAVPFSEFRAELERLLLPGTNDAYSLFALHVIK